MRLPPVLKFSKGVKYLPVLDPSLQGTGRSEKKRTPGLIFGSPAAGTPVRRGGAFRGLTAHLVVISDRPLLYLHVGMLFR